MGYLVWVGPRNSDVKFCQCFSESICYYSDTNPTSNRKANIYGKFFQQFVSDNMKNIIELHQNAKFVFYNPSLAYKLDSELRDYVLCLNDKYVLNLLSDKIYTRYWLGQYVPVLSSILMESHSLSFKELRERLLDTSTYIIQQNKSSGGFGTFYVTEDNKMLDYLKEKYNELLIISPYIESGVSINVNAIIGKEQIDLFPPSLQIVEVNQNRMLYHGADYITAQSLSPAIHEKIKRYSYKILEHIQFLGYKGIIGLDFIAKDNNVYFLEINPRYQASSFLIDASLNDYHQPSLSEMNINSFNEQITPVFKDIEVNYSYYKYLYKEENNHIYHIEQCAKTNSYIKEVLKDGWDSKQIVDLDAYCYSVVFNTNITSLNFDGGYNLYSNINGEETYFKEYGDTQIGIKIALLNQGCVIENNVIEFLDIKGIIKKAVFSSIDFQLSTGLYINAPVNLKFTDFSPFHIRLNKNEELELYHYSELISKINIEMQPVWNDLKTHNNIPFGNIAYLSTDRLRLKHQIICEFKNKGEGCSFCSIPAKRVEFDMHDLREVVETLLKRSEFRHILIGGGSGDINNEYKKIIEIANLIRRFDANIPIYLMSLPPVDKEILYQYKAAGISEIAFNIEIWDRTLAKEIMPGKGQISLALYLNTLIESTKIWGTSGNVRTAFIVGLNNTAILLKAISILCKNGIQPMLSVFRPMPNTTLKFMVPPSNFYLLNFYYKAQQICKLYALDLGPSCDACKNNMLSI